MKTLIQRPRSLKEWLVVMAMAALGAGAFVVVRTLRHRSGDWYAGDANHVPTDTSPATPRPTAAETAQAAAAELTGLTVDPRVYGEQPSGHDAPGDEHSAGKEATS